MKLKIRQHLCSSDAAAATGGGGVQPAGVPRHHGDNGSDVGEVGCTIADVKEVGRTAIALKEWQSYRLARCCQKDHQDCKL